MTLHSRQHELQIHHKPCLHFKTIHDYFANKYGAATVSQKAKNYILCHGILFPVFVHP